MVDEHTPLRVGVRQLRDNLAAYMRKVQDGASVQITSHDRVIAESRPAVERRRPRRLGMLRGKIKMAADFDATPAELIDAMEGSD